MRPRLRGPDEWAFTLLELVLVLAILSILAAVLAPLVKNAVDDSRVSKAKSLLHSVSVAAGKYHASSTASTPPPPAARGSTREVRGVPRRRARATASS